MKANLLTLGLFVFATNVMANEVVPFSNLHIGDDPVVTGTVKKICKVKNHTIHPRVFHSYESGYEVLLVAASEFQGRMIPSDQTIKTTNIPWGQDWNRINAGHYISVRSYPDNGTAVGIYDKDKVTYAEVTYTAGEGYPILGDSKAGSGSYTLHIMTDTQFRLEKGCE